MSALKKADILVHGQLDNSEFRLSFPRARCTRLLAPVALNTKEDFFKKLIEYTEKLYSGAQPGIEWQRGLGDQGNLRFSQVSSVAVNLNPLNLAGFFSRLAVSSGQKTLGAVSGLNKLSWNFFSEHGEPWCDQCHRALQSATLASLISSQADTALLAISLTTILDHVPTQENIEALLDAYGAESLIVDKRLYRRRNLADLAESDTESSNQTIEIVLSTAQLPLDPAGLILLEQIVQEHSTHTIKLWSLDLSAATAQSLGQIATGWSCPGCLQSRSIIDQNSGVFTYRLGDLSFAAAAGLSAENLEERLLPQPEFERASALRECIDLLKRTALAQLSADTFTEKLSTGQQFFLALLIILKNKLKAYLLTLDNPATFIHSQNHPSFIAIFQELLEQEIALAYSGPSIGIPEELLLDFAVDQAADSLPPQKWTPVPVIPNAQKFNLELESGSQEFLLPVNQITLVQGAAATGKTFLFQHLLRENPGYQDSTGVLKFSETIYLSAENLGSEREQSIAQKFEIYKWLAQQLCQLPELRKLQAQPQHLLGLWNNKQTLSSSAYKDLRIRNCQISALPETNFGELRKIFWDVDQFQVFTEVLEALHLLALTPGDSWNSLNKAARAALLLAEAYSNITLDLAKRGRRAAILVSDYLTAALEDTAIENFLKLLPELCEKGLSVFIIDNRTTTGQGWQSKLEFTSQKAMGINYFISTVRVQDF